MRQQKSLDEKRTSKDTKKTKLKTGHGGSRTGAGRKGYNGPMMNKTLIIATAIEEGIKWAKIAKFEQSKYIADLIFEDLKKRGLPEKLETKIEFAYTRKE